MIAERNKSANPSLVQVNQQIKFDDEQMWNFLAPVVLWLHNHWHSGIPVMDGVPNCVCARLVLAA